MSEENNQPFRFWMLLSFSSISIFYFWILQTVQMSLIMLINAEMAIQLVTSSWKIQKCSNMQGILFKINPASISGISGNFVRLVLLLLDRSPSKIVMYKISDMSL